MRHCTRENVRRADRRALFERRFLGTDFPVCPNRVNGSPFLGEECAVAQRGIAALAAGAKRKGHPWFPFLFELLPFLQRVWAQMVDCVSVEKEYVRGFFLLRGILTFAFRIIHCYTYRLFYAGRGTR